MKKFDAMRGCGYALLAVLGFWGAAQISSGAGADGLYIKKASWPETMIATREKVAEWKKQNSLQMTPWYAAEPQKAPKFTDSFFPEKGVELNGKDAKGQPLWKVNTEMVDGQVHNLNGFDRCATYLFRTITASEPRKLNAGFGSDDGIEVWLNGQKILSKDVPRGAEADQDRATLDLKAGENQLLMKIYNISGGHGFYFSAGEQSVSAVWQQIEKDFPLAAQWMRDDFPNGGYLSWFGQAGAADMEQKMIQKSLDDLGGKGQNLQQEFDGLKQSKSPTGDPRWLAAYEQALPERSKRRALQDQLGTMDTTSLRLAIEDLSKTFPDKYTKGAQFLKQLDEIEKELTSLPANQKGNKKDPALMALCEKLQILREEALLSNPLLDFDKLMFIRRKTNQLGLAQNWQGNCSLPRTGYDNELMTLSPARPNGKTATLFTPPTGRYVGDVNVHWDADRMLISMTDDQNRWQVWELKGDGTGLRQITGGDDPDVDNYYGCYLPSGKIIFDSNRVFHGVPCVGGADWVANLYTMDSEGKSIRQLCFDQDHNWYPTMLNNGRVMYTRWEYADISHYFSRLMFSMNPDGTNQMAYYGSNSFWPNSLFYAKAIPDHPTQFVGIVSGHHGVARMGELIIFDPEKGRTESNGVVQRIPGYGKKVEPIIRDTLVDGSWPKFLHPYPLSGKYFLVSSQPNPQSPWGVYLVDVFDNMLLLADMKGQALFEPIPLHRTVKPPVVPDRVKLNQDWASVYMTDIYQGPGLQGVPRGAVKNLRVYEYHFAYPKMGGHVNVGVQGPWDVHRIHGTVPVYEDGSAFFKVPSNIPVAVQPLDSEGRAIQVMRSWFVAMPGESLSCVGCHESSNSGSPAKQTIASRKDLVDITPWYGPARGFSFKREVQPVLEKYCVGCHDGQGAQNGMAMTGPWSTMSTALVKPNFAAKDKTGWGGFTLPYLALHPFVRRPGPENDYHIQQPCEYHADTSELFQMLRKGHHGVKLDGEAWDRLYTWMDLNVPDHGTWTEHHAIANDYRQRRLEMRKCYANRPEDPETIPETKHDPIQFVAPAEKPKPAKTEAVLAAIVVGRVGPVGPVGQGKAEESLKVDLGGGQMMELARIPSGEFNLGDAGGCDDEAPVARVKIEKPFYMGRFEVTQAQFNQ
ncbi:MAG: SUMF1/EgtB/PvdO family nonheme iron enzyme, partial [Candidatus Sumerlaeota bacterium]|nr:SUMF1/EgtB/PvdO family nonheme iron enzyme [Candidatus Sumerlaeota bacterium]